MPDPVYTAVREHFEDADLASLIYAVVAINGWNRVAISFRSVAGSYTSQRLSGTWGDLPKLRGPSLGLPPPHDIAEIAGDAPL